MALLKTKLKNGEIAIFDEAVIYKRGEYWQFRMWLEKENKYVRQSLKMDFTRFDRHIIMSQLKRRKLNEGYQIHSRI